MRAQVIAEVASNHGGDQRLAKEFIRLAAEAGADFVKFQSWQARHMSPNDPQYEWFVRSELSDAAHYELIEECGRQGIQFLTTCFEVERVPFLASLGISTIKVGSADTSSLRMLRLLREHFEHVILSTGMATNEEVRNAVEVLRGRPYTLMHTVSLYPTPPDRVRLRRMLWLRQFTPSAGYSDHSVGLDAVKIAIAAGAAYVEKHFCLSRNGPGRVMPWDMTPEELEEIVRFSRMGEPIMGEEQLPITDELLAARARYIGRFGDNR